MQTFRAGGKGGQNQNTRNMGVRIIDKRTGLTAEGREQRSQEQNRQAAFLRLALRIIEQCKAEERSPVFIQAEAAGWGAGVVRTYKPMQSFVLDHRTRRKYPYQPTMEGDLEPIHRDLLGTEWRRSRS